MNNMTLRWVMRITSVGLILFCLFIAYQMLRIILGGSWTISHANFALLLALVIFIFYQTRDLGEVKSNLKNLTKQFSALAKDFKEHLRNHK